MPHLTRLIKKYPTPQPFAMYVLFSTFLILGDAIMSYATPVFLAEKISTSWLMGIVFSFSSVVGLVFDFIAGQKLEDKSTYFYIKLSLITAILFPLTFLLLPNSILTFLLALTFWGIYYETHAFSNFKFIEETKKKEEFSEAWGMLSMSAAISYLIGPVIATLLISYFINLSFFAALSFYIFSLVILILVRRDVHEPKHQIVKKTPAISLAVEFKTWFILFKRIWPIWIFGVTLAMVDAFFWTIGIIYAESLKPITPAAGFIMSAYIVPTILVGMIASRTKIVNGKKHLMLLTSLVASAVLMSFVIFNNVYLMLCVVAIYSIFSSISLNLLSAVYEDYIARTESFDSDIIGLEQSARSLAYIIGPIIAGILTHFVGEKFTLGYAGVILFATTAASIVIMPKKIHIPHKALSDLANSSESKAA